MMQCADDVVQNCTLETCMVLLTNVTPINSITNLKSENKKIKRQRFYGCSATTFSGTQSPNFRIKIYA